MLKRLCYALSLVLAAWASGVAAAERIPEPAQKIEPPTPQWRATVEQAAPAKPTVPAAPRKLLVFSLFTGFDHKVIPHVNCVFEILGQKTGAFTAIVSVDIESLTPPSLAAYDVLVLNNNCSQSPRRNLFLDVLESDAKYRDLSEPQREAKSAALEQSLLEFVAK